MNLADSDNIFYYKDNVIYDAKQKRNLKVVMRLLINATIKRND